MQTNNPATAFAAALAAGFIPSAQECKDLATALHEASTHLPEFLWVAVGFEAVADDFTAAMRCADEDNAPADQSWMARQDRALEVA